MSTLDLSRSEGEADVFDGRNAKRGARGSRWIIYALLIFVGLLMIFPFLWLVSSSLKSQLDVFAYPPKWIPEPIVWQNYIDAMTFRPFGLYLRNSLTIAGLNVIAVVFTSSFCA